MIQGVRHRPVGNDDVYSVQPVERFRRDPMAGEEVLLNIMTWPEEPSQSVWVSWTKNGVVQPDVGATWKSNNGNVESFWQPRDSRPVCGP